MRVHAQTQTETEHQRIQQAIAATILAFKNKGQKERYVKIARRILHRLERNANMFDSEAVKAYILTAKKADNKTDVSNGHRRIMSYFYNMFCEENQTPFDKPKIKYKAPIALIPTTENVNKIINAATRKYAVIFRILATTAVEGEELAITHRSQIDTEQGILSIKGIKGHLNGTCRLKPEIAEMLRQYLATHTGLYPFPPAESMGDAWRQCRAKVAKAQCQPELLKIQLKSLRNYAGAIFYKTKGKDPIATQRFMRHTLLTTTQKYLMGMVIDGSEEYETKAIQLGTPTTLREIMELSDAGFTKFTEADGYQLFRKLK